jgi:hypothetical protein
LEKDPNAVAVVGRMAEGTGQVHIACHASAKSHD